MNIPASALLLVAARFAAAGIVNWPLDDVVQFVTKLGDDCPFGEVTPSGC
ncbi:hypothetical protein CP532_6860, partial [Ophiocordyceps camponoti-leonardi (nom. inval.)]